MAPLPFSIMFLAFVSVASSNPLASRTPGNLRINSYNPMRKIADFLCTNFETSFCEGNRSAASANHILPKASIQNDWAIPPLCEPSNFMDYRNFVDPRPFHSISEPSGTKQGCCMTCYDAGNCLSWVFNPISLQCNYYTATTKGEDGFESEVCPLGVDKGSYEEMSGWPVALGSGFGHNYGPCLGDAPLGHQEAYVRGWMLETSNGREEIVSQDPISQQKVVEL